MHTISRVSTPTSTNERCSHIYKPLQLQCQTAFSRRAPFSAGTWRPTRHKSRRTGAATRALSSASGDTFLSERDFSWITRAAQLADSSSGKTQPHPNAGCILVNRDDELVAQAFQWAQGTESPESQVANLARDKAKGSTAYLNLETGNCHGDDTAVQALIQIGVSHVVVGLRHPISELCESAITAYRQAGLKVSVVGECQLDPHTSKESETSAFRECLMVNEALLHRAILHKPFGLLKYAMTMDGKIATTTGHSAWVSSSESRARVFEARSRSDVVIVGGNTLRRDNPRLTTRMEGGHQPARIVMSRTLDLPQNANLWDVSHAPTIVMTQQGARREFQKALRGRGVEVVEFPFLTPEAVSSYCFERGYLQCLWECGGTLAAPAIGGGAIHKTLAFIAPKLVGGCKAPTPVGDLGFVEMTQAIELLDVSWQQSGPDLMMTGYLPNSRGLFNLIKETGPSGAPSRSRSVEFYKSWDTFGSFSNFSPHPITVANKVWASTEHFYQSQKFHGVSHRDAVAVVEAIEAASCSEEAAAIGRRTERLRPELVRPDWADVKVEVMLTALREKFSTHVGPRDLLLSTGDSMLTESSPHDFFWGRGFNGQGANMLGKLLMRVRSELR